MLSNKQITYNFDSFVQRIWKKSWILRSIFFFDISFFGSDRRSSPISKYLEVLRKIFEERLLANPIIVWGCQDTYLGKVDLVGTRLRYFSVGTVGSCK